MLYIYIYMYIYIYIIYIYIYTHTYIADIRMYVLYHIPLHHYNIAEPTPIEQGESSHDF